VAVVLWNGCGKFAGSNETEATVFAGSKLRMAKIREKPAYAAASVALSNGFRHHKLLLNPAHAASLGLSAETGWDGRMFLAANRNRGACRCRPAVTA
jgi:hypothetical protein